MLEVNNCKLAQFPQYFSRETPPSLHYYFILLFCSELPICLHIEPDSIERIEVFPTSLDT